MNIKEVRKLLDPQFGYWAKSTGELLYAHHFSVWSICRKICNYVPSLDSKEKELLEIACLIHDIGKMRKEIQDNLKAGREPGVPHKVIDSNEIKQYLKTANWETSSENEINTITDIIRPHHGVSDKDLKEITTACVGFYTLILYTSDWLASMEHISYETINKLKRIFKDKIELITVEYSRFPSPTTNLMVNKIVEKFRENKWESLCFPENGILFTGKSAAILPSKKKIIDNILSEIIKKSLKLQEPIPGRADREHLTLLSKDFPYEFLEIHKKKVIDSLGDVDRKGFVFLKYWKDIASVKQIYLGKKANENIVKLINLACSSAGNLKNQAKVMFKELFNELPDNPKDMLNRLFYKIRIEDILPLETSININMKAYLKDLKGTQLFSLLENLILLNDNNISNTKKMLYGYLDSLVSMEEETDFKKIAKEIFNRYKLYKKTSDAEKGCCERCGGPLSYKMQPALNISNYYRPAQGFSEIKSKYGYRSICPFCGYDNLVLREGAFSNRVRVYLRIQSKVSDLFVNFEELKILINRLNSGVKNPRSIIKFKEKEELKNLPFPERIEIPVSEEKEKTEGEALTAENGVLFHLDDIRDENFSPKDAKVKYEPLYHIMKLIGFKVALGTEEQEGLFGEEIDTNEESYYKSLATILLAKINEKKQKKYIFSRSILEKSPNITIKVIGDSIKDKKLTEGLVKCLLKEMIKSKIVIAKPKEIST